ncbi:hypothetical protein BH23GEM10_BH23GEM10_17720 [soil metagenome]
MRRPLDSRAGVILVLAVILLATGVAIVAAMLRTSTTFDEIVMVAGGARGYETGDWHLVPEHPPLVQYIYGLPVYVAGALYPDESGVSDELRTDMGYRYLYARKFYWLAGNDPERIAFLGRLPAVLIALTLVTLAFLYARNLAGPRAGVLAALLTASLPDVLAHGGVAYNDIALALAFLAAVWGIDTAIRRPSLRRAAVAGGLIALALGVKNSAIVLAPIALVLLLWEAWARRRDAAWRRTIPVAVAATLGAMYLGLVAIYRGDFMLSEYRYALGFVLNQVTERPAPGFLLGEISGQGFWYFFPVAFLYKTSAGLHVLIALAAIAFASGLRADARRLMHSRLRAPVVALVIFGAVLLASDLNIGFRHALPLLPFITVLTAAGVSRLWPVVSPQLRVAISCVVLWTVVHVASYYPFFISYMSEYGPGRDAAHGVLVDSSLDWGQGLLELREFLADNDIPSVYFSYFGSALPGGYGIAHVPLLSYFPLPPQPPPDEEPRWIAVSATLVSGTYFQEDRFRGFREAVPSHIIARSILLFPVPERAP